MGGYLFVRGHTHLDEEPEGAKHYGCRNLNYESHFVPSCRPKLEGRQVAQPNGPLARHASVNLCRRMMQ